MTKPTKLEINCETGEETITELTQAEISALEAESAIIEAQRLAQEAEAEAKAEAKASAITKLAALGLTENEAKAIAG